MTITTIKTSSTIFNISALDPELRVKEANPSVPPARMFSIVKRLGIHLSPSKFPHN